MRGAAESLVWGTPAMAVLGVGLSSYQLTQSIADNGLADTAAQIARHAAELPGHLERPGGSPADGNAPANPRASQRPERTWCGLCAPNTPQWGAGRPVNAAVNAGYCQSAADLIATMRQYCLIFDVLAGTTRGYPHSAWRWVWAQ